MRAQNLYNGALVVGCRFAFTLPVESTLRADAGTAAPEPLVEADTTSNPTRL